MSTGTALAIIAAAYLVGSIPWSYLIVRLRQGMDIRAVGSGNVGATNVLRTAGKGAGIVALLLDAGKGVAVVLVTRALDAPAYVVCVSAVAVVLGHVFPVFLRFRGGKGVATAAGALGALAPVVLALSLLGFVVIVLWKRYVSLGSILAAALFPVFAWIGSRLGWVRHEGAWVVLSSAAIAAVVLARHASNLRRLLKGTERRLGEPRSIRQ
ncbi:MAG TPA: glycerol-3-phosphate 1-O-acyltransferase PlsY [Thermoanaerobaculia bacterium]|nr:glycerol-3-phosphate 1-O-acyltransferase PlsY [Thermoanaerobaculia bacterium]